MTLHRFYLPHSEWTNSEELCLDIDESRHCIEVLRMKIGDPLIVFDGVGKYAEACITHIQKNRVRVCSQSIGESVLPTWRVTLAQAIPKGKNMDLVLQKATELGVSAIQPLITERTVVRLSGAEAVDKQEKWQRMVVEACKQCGQNHMPIVGVPLTLGAYLTQIPAHDVLLVAALHGQARPLKHLLAKLPQAPRSAIVFIGPEGDFTPGELDLAESAGCLPLSLGPIILRTETAAIYSLSIVSHELKE